MKQAEENAAKKLELLERQSNYMRSRASSAVSTGKMTENDNLEGVWQIIKEIREKMTSLQETIEEGVIEKCKELNMSVIEKDNELLKLLEESDNKMREMKNDFRKEIKELKEKHKLAVSSLSAELDSLKLEKVDFMKKVNELEMERQGANLNSQKVKILLEQNNDLKKELKNREENMVFEKDVISDFVKQIEDGKAVNSGFEDKLKEIKKKGIDCQEKLAILFQTVTSKKKLNDKEIQDLIEKVNGHVKSVIMVMDDNSRMSSKKKL